MKKKVVVSIIVIGAIALAAALPYFLTNGNRLPRSERGSDPVANGELVATKNDLIESASLIEIISREPERFRLALASQYQMSQKKADKLLQSPEDWLSFEQIVEIKNVGGKNISVYGFEISDNGKNGIYISTKIGGRLDLAPGSSASASFNALCENADLSFAQAQEIIDKMKVKAVYSETPKTFGDGSESVEETKTAAILDG